MRIHICTYMLQHSTSIAGKKIQTGFRRARDQNKSSLKANQSVYRPDYTTGADPDMSLSILGYTRLAKQHRLSPSSIWSRLHTVIKELYSANLNSSAVLGGTTPFLETMVLSEHTKWIIWQPLSTIRQTTPSGACTLCSIVMPCCTEKSAILAHTDIHDQTNPRIYSYKLLSMV